MKDETVVWIIIGSLLIIGFVLGAIKKPRFLTVAGNVFWILGLLFLITHDLFANNSIRYSLMSDIALMKKYHLAQVDSSMALISADKNSRQYVAYNFNRDTNAVFHYSKEITLDIYDVYNIKDEFANWKIKKDLVWIYQVPTWFRDSSSIYYLRNWDDIRDEHVDTLTKPEFIKTLSDWGLTEKIFKEYHPYTYHVPLDTIK